MTEQDEVAQAIQNIQAKKIARTEQEESSLARTKRLFHWNGRDKWEYRMDFIRGKNMLWSGLPHVYESTCPAYLMSKAELQRRGFKPGNARPIAYTHNVKASVYGLYDIRDCVPISGEAAHTRRVNGAALIRELQFVTRSFRGGWDVLVKALEDEVK